MAADAGPQVFPILGTMTFGIEGQVRSQEAGILLRTFVGTGCTKVPVLGAAMVDTARVYQQATPHGDTETILGEHLASSPSLASRVSIATKANPNMAPHFSLSRQSVLEQCETSLERLGVDCVELFYLHWPDPKTDLAETLAAVRQLHEEGKIKEFGLSNYPAWMVVDIWHRCKALGMVRPTVYQGMYNVLTRTMEAEIVPVAREFGLRLYMYNPLAGGLLSGRYKTMEDLTSAETGRFSSEFDNAFGTQFKAGQVYRARYSKRPLFEALARLREAVGGGAVSSTAVAAEAAAVPEVQEMSSTVQGVRVNVRIEETQIPREQPQAVTMANVALRWLIHHSMLAKGDGIILGVSKMEHLTSNLAAWRGGPLPVAVVEACDVAWELARPACEAYFRGLGAKPGGIERFLELQAQRRSRGEDDEEVAEGSEVKRPRVE